MSLRNLFRRGDPVSRVRMINSVDDQIAGLVYELPCAVADAYIARGYAEGNYSRSYYADEVTELRSNDQIVGI